MTSEIVKIKMPLRRGHWVIEKEVPFLFKIMTLEMIADYLKIPMEDLFKEENLRSEKMPLALVWCGYLAACKESYRKPKYKEIEAVKWNEYMPKGSRDLLTKAMGELLGNLPGKKQEGDTSEKKK